MATLEKIRNKAGLLVGVVGVALFAFIIGDFLRSGSTFFHQSKEKIAIVDGQSINYQDYQKKVDDQLERYKAQRGNASLGEEEQAGIRQQVFEYMVNQILMEKESEEIGFVVSKDEMKDIIMGDHISPMIQQMPDFINPQTQQFDKSQLLQFLQMIETDDLSGYSPEVQMQIQNAKNYWWNVEQSLKQQQLQNKFNTLVGLALVPNSLDAKAAYEESKISVDFDYVSQAYTSVSDDQVSVSDSELKQLYEKRKENCKQEAAKVVSYIAVSIVPSEKDYKEVETHLDEVKPELAEASDVADIVNDNSDVPYLDAFVSASRMEDNMKNFVEKASVGDVDGPALVNDTYYMYKLVAKTQAPDSVRWNQMMLPAGMDDAQIKTLTDSLILVIKGGKPFAEMAQELTNGQMNGDMGWQTEAAITRGADAKFKDVIFNASLNDVFVTKSSLGTHLVQVVEKTKPVEKYKVANIQVAVVPSTETRDHLYTQLAEYVSKNTKLETFKSAASEAGYVCQNGATVYPNQPILPGVNNSRQAIRWALDHKKGAISDIFDCQSHLVVMAMEGSLKEGYCPFNAVSEILKRELINEKKGEKIIADLKSKNLSSMEQYAEAMGSTVQSVKFVTFATPRITGLGTEPVVNAKAPIAEVGQVTAPMAGKNGVYVLKVTDKKESEVPFDAENQKQSLRANNFYRVYQAPQILKEKASVEDNRSRFY